MMVLPGACYTSYVMYAVYDIMIGMMQYSQLCLIGIGISGSDQDFSPDSTCLS